MPVQNFRFRGGYYARLLASAVLLLILGLAGFFGGIALGSGWSWLRFPLLLIGFFLSGIGLIGGIAAIFNLVAVQRTSITFDSNGIIFYSGSREIAAFKLDEIVGLHRDYETIYPTRTGLRFVPAEPTGLRLIAPDKTVLILGSRMQATSLQRLSRLLVEQTGQSLQKPLIGPEIATFPTNKDERGPGGWLILTDDFMAGYRDRRSSSPVVRHGDMRLFLPTEQIKVAEPASTFDLPGSNGSGRTARLRITLFDDTIHEISLGYAGRLEGPDYRLVLEKWLSTFKKLKVNGRR